MRTFERLLVPVATVLVLAVNGLANTGALGSVTTGEVAALYTLPFTPAGWVFAIWGLIYTGLIAFSLFQAAGAGARLERVERLRPVYVFSAAANVAWLWFWHHQALGASLVVMLLLLAALFVARRIVTASPAGSPVEFGCVDLPFRLYVAWISIATLANLAVVVAYAGGAGGPRAPVAISLVMLAAALAIAAVAWRRLRDPVFLLVIAWAALGIALRHGQPTVVSGPAIVVFALAGLAAIGLLWEDARALRGQSTTG